MARLIDDVDVVDRLQFGGLANHFIQCLAGGEVFADPGEGRRHHRSGRAFRVCAEPADVAAVLDGDQRHQFLDRRRGDLGEQVDAIVGRQVADQGGDLVAVLRLANLDLFGLVQIPVDFRPQRRVGVLEDGPGLAAGQPFHEFGDHARRYDRFL